MANLVETEQWEPGIYQFETEDIIDGGVDGTDNVPTRQLANRTKWLKAQVEALGNGKQPLDATLTALAALATVADRLIYSTGPDTFAITPLSAFIRTLLDDADAATARATLGAISQAQLDAAIAALVNASPAALDTLNELAAALGNDANFATTMTNALAAKLAVSAKSSTAQAQAGADDTTYMTPLKVAQAVPVVTSVNDAGYADNSVKPASTSWIRGAMAAIATAAGFAASLTSNGYIKFPSWLGGVMFQWGNFTTSAGAGSATFPLAFPNNAFAACTRVSGSGTLSNVSTLTLTTIGATTYNAATAGALSASVGYLAFGN